MEINRRKEASQFGISGEVDEARFTFTDFFAGIGGCRIGLEALGGKCVYSVERNKFARKTYAAWFGAAPEGIDINHIDRAAIPVHDLLTASFPCPAFSKAGVSTRRALGRASGLDADDDGRHIFTLAEILGECHPAAFIFENVTDLVGRKQGQTWDIVHNLLTDVGYEVFAKIFNAKHFRVPQRRERVIIVGLAKSRFGDAPSFRFSEPQSTTVPILSDILEPHPDPKYTLHDGTWQFLQRHKAKHAALGNGYGYRFASPRGISNTLSSRYGKDGSEILIEQAGKNPRKLSPRETARLMGFPDHLPIVVSDTQAYIQFGNAVVPAIISAVAADVLKIIERHPT